jgi:hypothetical protein
MGVRLEPFGQLNASDPRHIHVKKYDVSRSFFDKQNGIMHIGSLTDDLDLI